MKDKAKSIILCQDNIGDVVFTSVIVESLSKQGYSIDYLCRKDTRDIVAALEGVSRIYSPNLLNKLNLFTGFRQFKSFFDMLFILRKNNYELAVLPAKNWRLGFLCVLAGIPTRIGFAHKKLSPFLTKRITKPDLNTPVVTALGKLVSGISGLKAATNYKLDLTSINSNVEKLALLDKKQQLGKKWVGIHAFASLRNRCVSLSVWVDLAKKISGLGFYIVWFGTADDLRELSHFDEVPGAKCNELANGTLADSIGVVSVCDAYIGHDSGILHVASGCGVQTLGVFSPGEPYRTFAQGLAPTYTLYKNEPCLVTCEEMFDVFIKEFSHLL